MEASTKSLPPEAYRELAPGQVISLVAFVLLCTFVYVDARRTK